MCWDYALAESLFGVSKTEFVYRREYPSRRKLMRSVARNIATCYSRERIHSALEYLIYRWHTPTPCVGEGSIGPNWTDSSVGVSRGRTVNLPQGSPLNRTEHKIWYSHPDSDHYRLCSRWPGPARWRALSPLTSTNANLLSNSLEKTLDAAYAANPMGFGSRQPVTPKLPTTAWISRPRPEALIQSD